VADRTRALSRLLAPTSRQQGGLATAMRRLCESARSYCTAEVSLRVSGTLPELDSWQANQVHLIAQESLRNAIRHGSPTRIHVNLASRPETLVLRITSDEQPWNPADQSDGLGLRIVRHRAETLNATATIRVRPSGVTQVRLIVPLGHHLGSPPPS
jgi:signal transduction histidine kinase